MEIIRITYGRTTLPESAILQGGEKDRKIPIVLSVFLIKAGERNILVDAGCEDLPGFELMDFQPATSALKEQGIATDDITDVIITHAHHDHAQCVRDYPNARVWVQEQEYARKPHYFVSNPNITTFRETAMVAEGIRAVRIGGHTTGSSVVECEKDGNVYVLCGDECYCRYNLENRIPTASSKCPDNSKAFIEKYTQAPYICLLCHEA